MEKHIIKLIFNINKEKIFILLKTYFTFKKFSKLIFNEMCLGENFGITLETLAYT